MSDRNHIEYCIKLGNTLVQNKLELSKQNQYIEAQTSYDKIPKQENISFRDRLQNWK